MPLTPDFEPDEAIIRIDDERVVIDAAKYVIGVLRRDWKPENTDGKRPQVDFAENTKNVQFRSDWIIVYGVTDIDEMVGVTYQFKNNRQIYSLDLYTPGDRSHMIKFVAELERVIHSIRTNPFGLPTTSNDITGRQWIKFKPGSTLFERTTTNLYRRSIDIEIVDRYKEIRT